MHRLAVGNVSLGGSSHRNPETRKIIWVAWRLCIVRQAVSGIFPETQ